MLLGCINVAVSVSDNFLITTKLLTVSISRDKHELSFQLEGLQRFILASARFTTWHGHGVTWTWTGKAWLWLGMARIMVRCGMGCSPIQLKGRAPMETHRGFTVFRAIPEAKLGLRKALLLYGPTSLQMSSNRSRSLRMSTSFSRVSARSESQASTHCSAAAKPAA